MLAAALRKGISPQTQFASKPVEIDAGDRIWRVTNYEDSYLGNADLWRAMIHSDNAVYAQLTQFVGPRAVVQTAHELGIRSDLPAYFSIGLGAVAVNPLDMARAYATLANDGDRIDGSLMGNRPRVVDGVRYRKSGRTTANAPVERSVLSAESAETVTQVLSDVVESGTGRRAQIAGRAIAGKTGTTDNYGDAWFVGYTPELVVAVWVGYPNELRPMLTEFGGEPVAGGTLPTLVWRSFMTKALAGVESGSFAPAPYLPAEYRRVVWRGGSWKLDNGYCPGTKSIAFIAGRAPTTTATCYPNEVSVPLVIGRSAESARATLSTVPLDGQVVLIPAKAGRRPGLVVNQEPRGGYLSANGPVKLFVSHAQNGLVPNLVGSSEAEARAQLRRLKLRTSVTTDDGPPGVVLRQSLTPGVASKPGLRIRLVVGRGDRPWRRARAPSRRPRRGRTPVARPAPRDRPTRTRPGWARRSSAYGVGRLAQRVPASTKRHGRSTARVIPIRDVVTWPAGSSAGGRSANGASRRSAPLSAPSIPSACVRRPGPAQSRRSVTPPRRRRISSIPCVGSSARRSTAAPVPAGPQTTFAHQCRPYER